MKKIKHIFQCLKKDAKDDPGFYVVMVGFIIFVVMIIITES